MLRNIQIKIILIFLLIGAVIIAAMGYVNYSRLQAAVEQVNQGIR